MNKTHKLLTSIPGARSAWRLGCALKVVWLDGAENSQAELTHVYRLPIAFDYIANEAEVIRHRNELAMLDRVIGAGRFNRALEIGCAEGIFTEQLANRCDSLLAVDFLEVAAVRARQRVGSKSAVNFGVLNIRLDPLPGEFDLICAIHVLDYIRNPLLLRKIREQIVSSLKPGGYLLIGGWTIDPNASYWWSRHFLRGSRRISEFFASHPKLTLVESVVHSDTPTDSEFIDVLLQMAV